MLPRDVDADTYLRRYFPKTDIMSFQRDMFNADRNMIHLIAFEKPDVDEVVSSSTNMMYISGATIVTAFLGGVVMFNKLPLFNRIQSKWGRFIAKSLLFVVPVWIVSGYNIYQQNLQLEKNYKKYFPQYIKYKCTGNILDLNPNIKCKNTFLF